jgi:tRNA (cmo5U34)-methyltransferase
LKEITFQEAVQVKDDTQKTWDQDRAKSYLQNANLMVVERKRTLAILERLFAYHFQQRKGLTLLDLGCGDGFVTEVIRSKNPDNIFYLMDGSDFMIERAKERLKGPGLFFLTEKFERYLAKSSDAGKYDFVYSANAIHHLDWWDKKRLYSKVFKELKHGGLFINTDPVAPSSDRSEQWQFRLWTDWMREAAEEYRLTVDPGLIERVPSEYKGKPENKPDGLLEQLQMLQETGFRDVDCFYKYGVFALFGGTK